MNDMTKACITIGVTGLFGAMGAIACKKLGWIKETDEEKKNLSELKKKNMLLKAENDRLVDANATILSQASAMSVNMKIQESENKEA